MPRQVQAIMQRCAIYTRKSTQLGLERDFNTLESQRAICSAYISSQRHKGWAELTDHYDDGGFSGASLERPELQRLLGDVERGVVDVVVVYKLDRMTRTLLDFVRLVDFFERHGVVFVSITQNFDTADSMGRLVMNILLTFAQFEREMAADRIRDKMRATKQSGRWAGGPAPLGYDLVRRRLHVNEEERKNVQFIFQRYLQLQNLTAVHRECRAAGLHSKKWRTRAGKVTGGGAITKSLVNHVLGNPVYRGLIRHRDQAYPGLHAPIIDQPTWDQVQAIRADQAKIKAGRNKQHILTDLLFDCFGRPMSVTSHWVEGKSKRISRFYRSRQSAWGKRQNLKVLRARADGIEELVIAAIVNFFMDRESVRSMLLAAACHGDELDTLSGKCQQVGLRFESTKGERLRLALRALIVRIELSLERVKIVLRCCEVERYLMWDGVGLFKSHMARWGHSRTHLLDLPVGAIRYGRLLAMPVEPCAGREGPHPASGLRRLIKEARECQALVDRERGKTLAELAAEMNYTTHRFSRVLRLNYLAPDIITSIIDGTHPQSLTRTQLVKANLPMDWGLQRRLLGFPPRPGPEGSE